MTTSFDMGRGGFKEISRTLLSIWIPDGTVAGRMVPCLTSTDTGTDFADTREPAGMCTPDTPSEALAVTSCTEELALVLTNVVFTMTGITLMFEEGLGVVVVAAYWEVVALLAVVGVVVGTAAPAKTKTEKTRTRNKNVRDACGVRGMGGVRATNAVKTPERDVELHLTLNTLSFK